MKFINITCDFLSMQHQDDITKAINFLEQIGTRWSKPIGSWIRITSWKLQIKFNNTRAFGLFMQRLAENAISCIVSIDNGQ
jgi:hypothetical protein